MSILELPKSASLASAGRLGLATTCKGPWAVVIAQGDVGTADTLLFQGVLGVALERRDGWLVVDLSATGEFEVLPLAVLAKARARARALGGQLRLVIADDATGVLADLDRGRWNVSSTLAAATD